MRDLVELAINKIRPTLQKDGGDVMLVDVSDDGVVKVKLTGACRECQMSDATRTAIEKFLKNEIDTVSRVETE